jgi:hypothetical protein
VIDDVMRWMNIMCCTVLSLTVYSRGDLGSLVCGVWCICACCELWAMSEVWNFEARA